MFSSFPLSLQLKRQFPNARQCKECGFGPILHFKCDDLTAHHGQVLAGGVTINNACVKCKWFSGHIRDWPLWNGELDENLDVSSVDPITVARAAAAAAGSGSGSGGSGGGGGGGGGEGETKLQAVATQTREELVAARISLLEALDVLALLNGDERPARPAAVAAAPPAPNQEEDRRRLTPDLQRMVDEEMMTRVQALEMMPPMAPRLRVQTPPPQPRRIVRMPPNPNFTVTHARTRVGTHRETIERLERELISAELAVEVEARALTTGDDGTLEILNYVTMLVPWSERTGESGMYCCRHECVTLFCCLISLISVTYFCQIGRWMSYISFQYFLFEMPYFGQFFIIISICLYVLFFYQYAHESMMRYGRELFR